MKDLFRRSSAWNALVHGGAPRVFCVSMQRTGTTSVGKFYRDFGFRWAGWPADSENDWSGSWYEGDYERIFSSRAFRAANAFEDSPWFLPGFYRVLFHRFPRAKFILMTRDPDAWFESMLRHSNGNVLGRSKVHCRVYRRELEYFDRLRSGEMEEATENDVHGEKTMKLADCPEQYKSVYRLHSAEVQEFFGRFAPESLFVARLEDPDKWRRLGRFLGIDVTAEYASHENRSNAGV